MFACNSATTKNFQIDLMKSDKNHIHFMINYDPDVSISQIARRLKQFSCVQVWKMHSDILIKHFWKDKIFWTKGILHVLLKMLQQKLYKNILKIRAESSRRLKIT
jgi:putative transposase